MNIPAFDTQKELFGWLKANKALLIAQKKYQVKHADPIRYIMPAESITTKAVAGTSDPSIIEASLVINTTNILDSHGDVHIPGIWNKSLRESKGLYLLQEHKMSFEKIVTDNVKPSVKLMNWTDIGQSYSGATQALMFDVTIDKNRNPFMFDQYAKGYVKNHSVGMQYVKLDLALNSDSKYDAEEKAVWDKYIGQIVNQQDAIDQGYFWAVTEAKVIEGSAVPIGSNTATPTFSINVKEPSQDTPRNTGEPAKATQSINYNYITNNFKLS